MSKRRKTMTYFLKEDYEIYDSLPCSAVVFSVDDDYKIYYTNDTYNNGNFNQDNIIVEEECRKLFDDTIRSADTPKRLYFKSKNLSGGSPSQLPSYVQPSVLQTFCRKAFAWKR